MSLLSLPTGDDYPEAARRHADDADVLLAGNRPDGAAYLSGYVVECSLKALLCLESGGAPKSHNLSALSRQVATVCAVAGAKSARYLGPAVVAVPSGVIAAWRPEMRYAASSMTTPDAAAWVAAARAVLATTIHQMFLDGVA